MGMNNLDIMQATVDLFFFFFCAIMSITIRTNKVRNKSMKIFILLFTLAALLFFNEALAYLFKGNTQTISVAITEVANLVVFITTITLVNFYVRYIHSLLSERDITVSDRFLRIADALALVNIIILVVNLFYPWMYYFDVSNHYHRNYMWYVQAVISLIIVFLGAGVAIKNRKKLDIHSFVSIVLFSIIPIALTVVQIFVYGISLTNYGIGIGLIVMFISYMYDWTHEGAEQIDATKNNWLDVVVLFAFMLLSMSASVIACGRTIQKITYSNSELQSTIIAKAVAEGINSAGPETDLGNLIAKYEDDFDVRIVLVNRMGEVQAASDDSLWVSNLDNSYLGSIGFDEYYYEITLGYSYVTKYMENMNLYMIVSDTNPTRINVGRDIVPIIFVFIGGALVMGLGFGIICIREKKSVEAYIKRYEVSIKDEITGLYNRRGYENDCATIQKDDTLMQYCIIMMDLNGLKVANDSIGHEAGDELIIGSAKCMMNAFEGVGKAYRVGGDEFVALLRCSKDKALESIKTFDHLTNTWKGKLVSELTLSKGLVVCSEHPELSFEEMKAEADKLMYEDKERYYERTGKNRRKG